MTWRVALPRASPRSNDGTASVGYDAAGNIASRNGSYSYSPGTHRLSSGGGNAYANYDLNGNVDLISNASGTRTLAYTAFNLPASVTGTSGYGSTSYLYDGSHARIREVSSGAAASGTTYYLGGFEAHRRTDGVLELRHYLATPEGVVGIYTQRSNGVNDLRYWHKDHLGSVQVIADSAGSVKQGFLYDAWGNRTTRTLAGGEAYAEERSYTGHELLTEIGLVHMNGRIYDPVTGRFLQADPLVQDPFNGQSYNRYGYVLNNPLSFTDPTGFSWWTQWRRPIFAIAAAVVVPQLAEAAIIGIADATGETALVFATETGTILSPAGSAVAAAAGGFAAGGIQGGNIESAVQGALFAELNFGIGEITGHAPTFGTSQFAANVGLHAAVGCGQQAAAGGSCRAGALSGGFSAFAGPFVQGPMPVQFAAHIAIGGFASKLGGDKFENGAITAAFAYLFNELSRQARAQIIGAGAFLGWTAGTVAAGGCTAGTGGVCALGAPAMIIGSAALGAATGDAVATAVDKLTDAINGNSWLSPTPTSVYQLLSNVDNSVMKYGITNEGDPWNRYTQAFYDAANVRMDVIATFDYRAPARMLEVMLCTSYVAANGKLPPMSSRC